MARVVSLRVHQLRGEPHVVAGQVNAAIAHCEEHEFVHYRAMALILRGWASAKQGEFEKGISDIQEGLKKELEIGFLLYKSYFLALLADAFITNQRYEQPVEYLNKHNRALMEMMPKRS